MKWNAALIALIFPNLLSAQNEAYTDILNDPDVIWAVEITPYFKLEPYLYPAMNGIPRDSNINEAVPLKLINDDRPDATIGGILLSEKLLELLMNGKQEAFKKTDDGPVFFDAKARRGKLSRLDTIVIFDPETYEEKISVVENVLNADDILHVKLRQILFYRASTGTFDIYTSAFAPMISILDNNGNFRFYSAPFWFKLPPFSKKENARRPDLADPNIRWAYRMKTENNSPNLTDGSPLKNFSPPIGSQLLKHFRIDKNYDPLDPSWLPIPFEARADYGLRIDTTVIFDSETYEEKIKIEQKALVAEEIIAVKLSEDWFYDEKRQQLIVRLNAFAPMRGVFDNNQNFRFLVPIFWKKVR